MPPDSSTINIASYLPQMAQRQPDTLAVAFPLGRDAAGKQRYLRWSYAQLEEESNAIARGLHSIGITRGMRTVLMVKPSPEFFALVFAIFKIGAVLVGVDPGMGVKNLKTCLAEAEPEAFIGIRKAHIARMLLGWGKATNRINVLVGRRLFPFGSTQSLDQVRQRGLPASREENETVLADTQPHEIAAILFTSGSTGIPKGVVYTHQNFDAQVRALREAYDIAPGEIDLCTFPLFALYAPALGMSAIVPHMDFTKPGSVEPHDIFEPIEEFNVTNMFGSPALLNRISVMSGRSSNSQTRLQARECLSSLKRAISAGAPVPSRTIARLKTFLPATSQIFTPYGATESLPVCSIGSDEILAECAALTDDGKGVCIGKPVPSIDLRIIRIADEAIEAWSNDLEVDIGEIGEICVRGPQVTRSYFNRDASTKLAKIVCTDGTFFHRMGDLGYLDDKGRVWFCGRKSERVICSHRTYFTAMCEGVFDATPDRWTDDDGFLKFGNEAHFRTALVSICRNGTVVPVMCVEEPMKPDPVKKERWLARLRATGQRSDITKDIDMFVFYPDYFPTDIRHNSKINRPLLAKWAAKKLGGQPA